VVKDGEVVAAPLGKTFWVDAKVPEEAEAELMKDLEAEFRDHYTVSLSNYPVQDAYLPVQQSIAVDGRRGW
jgi:formylmethanofuran dehydrogenase subunit A